MKKLQGGPPKRQVNNTMNDPMQIEMAFQKIAFSITHGSLETANNLKCPVCGNDLLYSFTTGQLPGRYGLFLVSKHCGQQRHFSLQGKPPNFDESKVIPEYQKLEDEAAKQAQQLIQKLDGK